VAWLTFSKESLHKIGECAPRNIIDKLDTSIAALEKLFCLN
jgi:hypothetical protein